MIKDSYRPHEVFGPILPVGKSTGYELLKTGALRSIKCGRAIIIPRAAIEEFLRGEVPASRAS